MKKILSIAILMINMSAFAQDSATTSTPGPFTFSGYAEGYYSYDFNKPRDNNRPGFFYNHNRHNEFNINIAFLKAAYSAEKVRATVSLGMGTYMNTNYAAEPGTLKNIYEANAGFKIGKKNLWLDIGVLPSHIGFESAVSKDCWNLTRSLLADNTPFFEGGARLSYTSDNGKWLLNGLLINGWQRITRLEGNTKMSFGTQVQYKPSGKLTINYSTFLGTDKPDSVRLNRFYHNLYGIFQASDKFGIIAGLDIGTEQKTKGSSEHNLVYSPALILKYTIDNKWAFAVRGEYYSDENGIIISTGTANGFKTSGFSVNLDYAPAANLLFRIEGRSLNSKDAIFTKGNGTTRNNNFVTTSIALSL